MKKIFYIYLFFIFSSFGSFAKINNLVFQQSECGLKIAYAYTKVTNRYEVPLGTGLPCLLTIDSLPERCYEIIDAFVWTTLSESIIRDEPISLMIINPHNKANYFNTTKTGSEGDKCWGEFRTTGYRTSVKNSITGNGQYFINTNASDWEVDGFFLVIIYKDLTDEHEGHLTIMDGLITQQAGRSSFDTLRFNPACDNSSDTYFFSLVSDMQFGYYPEYIMHMNGTDHYIKCNFWNVEFRKSNVSKNQTSSVFGVRPLRNDCYSWLLSGVYFRTKTCKNCYFPEINIKAKGNDICPGDSVILSAEGGYYYEWTSIPEGFKSGQRNVVVSPLTTTRYVIKGLSEDSCYIGYDTVLVTVYPKPKATITPNGPTNFCMGDSVQLVVTPSDINHKAKWSNGISTDRIVVRESGIYRVVIENQFYCKDTVEIEIEVYDNPKVNILNKNDFRVCLGDSIELSSDKDFSGYDWSTGEKTKSIFVKFPGIYYLSVRDSNSCLAFDTVEVKTADLTLSYQSKIDLDSVCIGDTNTFLLNIYNTGTDSYLITDINFLKQDTNLKISADLPIPTNLNPGDSIKIRIVFSPDEIRSYSDSLKIFLQKDPCNEIKTIYVNAFGVPRFRIFIPDTVGYVKDENFCFPVFIQLIAKENSSLTIDYTTEISFDPYVFLPKFQFRIENGRRIIPLSSRNILVTEKPQLLTQICGLVMLGDSLTTTSIQNFNYKNSKICIESPEGSFAITGLCAIKSSRVLLLKEPEFNITPNPADQQVEISISSENLGEHGIEIFNVQSQKLFERKWFKSDNQYENIVFNIDLKSYSTGLYFILLTNKENFLIKQFLIIK